MKLKKVVKNLKKNETDIIKGYYNETGLIIYNQTTGEYILYYREKE